MLENQKRSFDAANQKHASPRKSRLAQGAGVAAITTTHGSAAEALFSPGGADVVAVPFNGPGDAPASTTITDGGGRKLDGVRVNLIFWGTGWTTNPPPNPSLVTVANDVASILAGPYMSSLEQYGAGFAHFEAAYLVTSSNPPNPFTTQNVQDVINGLIEGGTLPEPDEEATNYFHCVMMPPGVAFQNSPGQNLGGLHTYAEYTDVDFLQLDFDINDRSHMAWVLYGSRGFISRLFSHELVEACSDPEGDGIQVNPTNSTNWNEIGDVCNSARSVNGVVVQSYWSQKDQACVIPMDIPVRKQITCIHKTPRADTHHAIKIVGGVTVNLATNTSFRMTQEECISELDRGNTFFVVGADGSEAEVKVFIHFPPWEPRGIRYIATVADDSTEDNLLSLPECP